MHQNLRLTDGSGVVSKNLQSESGSNSTPLIFGNEITGETARYQGLCSIDARKENG